MISLYEVSPHNDYIEKDFEVINYPSGEFDIRILGDRPKNLTIMLNYEIDKLYEFFMIPFIVDILPEAKITVIFDYLPFSRQDRAFTENSSFGLSTAMYLLKGVDKIIVHDPHNLNALLAECRDAQIDVEVVKQSQVVSKYLNDIPHNKTILLSPDKGASLKTEEIAKEHRLPVVQAHKVRDQLTGKILETAIDEFNLQDYNNVVIIDDICDGGGTFIGIAKILREKGYLGQISLFTTFGFYTKGMDELSEHFDNIVCAFHKVKV